MLFFRSTGFSFVSNRLLFASICRGIQSWHPFQSTSLTIVFLYSGMVFFVNICVIFPKDLKELFGSLFRSKENTRPLTTEL